MVQFLIGCGIIIWNRLFRVTAQESAESRIFNDLWVNQFNNQKLLIISLICFLLFTSFLLLELYKLYYPTRKEALYQKLKIDKIIIMIENALGYVYDKLTERVELRRFIELPLGIFAAYFAIYPGVFVIIFYFLPQLIVATVFVVETIFFDQLVVIIKALNLLIIFLLSRTIVYMFKQYVISQLAPPLLFIDVSIDPISKEITYTLLQPKDMPPSPPGPKIETIIENFKTMCDFWHLFYIIYNYMVAIEDFNNNMRPIYE